jgi:hypothetical protein
MQLSVFGMDRVQHAVKYALPNARVAGSAVGAFALPPPPPRLLQTCCQTVYQPLLHTTECCASCLRVQCSPEQDGGALLQSAVAGPCILQRTPSYAHALPLNNSESQQQHGRGPRGPQHNNTCCKTPPCYALALTCGNSNPLHSPAGSPQPTARQRLSSRQ